jgi:hypothetical protein
VPFLQMVPVAQALSLLQLLPTTTQESLMQLKPASQSPVRAHWPFPMHMPLLQTSPAGQSGVELQGVWVGPQWQA